MCVNVFGLFFKQKKTKREKKQTKKKVYEFKNNIQFI